jgi:hypothetical protein
LFEPLVSVILIGLSGNLVHIRTRHELKAIKFSC